MRATVFAGKAACRKLAHQFGSYRVALRKPSIPGMKWLSSANTYVSPHSSSTLVESEWSLVLMNILDLRKVCGHRDPVLLTLGSLSYFPTGWTTVSTHRVTGG